MTTTSLSLRKKIASEQVTIGSWLQLPSPDTAEIMAHMGYDWLVVDMEHGSIDMGQLPNILRAITCGNHGQTTPPKALVRVPTAEKMALRRALDAGAHGLILPMIQSRAQLDAALDMALYPHAKENYGSRGVGYARANMYGKHFDAYMQQGEEELVFIAQIEHIDALHELEDIVQHPRLDAIMVGPYDLSASMGLMGNFTHALFQQVMAEIHSICRKHTMPMGSHVVHPDPQVLRQSLNQAKEQGYTFLAYGTDALFLWQGAARPRI